MIRRRTIAFLWTWGLAACGGSGDGDGGGSGPDPVNLTNFQVASAILGQSTATGGFQNNGGGPTPNQSGFTSPTGHVANGSLYVADSDNNRVLGWNQIPSSLGANADFVLGQLTFNTNTAGTSSLLLNQPASACVASGTLFVADSLNNRVLLFSPPPTTTGTAASLALGQANLNSSGAGTGATGLNFPNDVCVAANRIVVADTTNNRVLIWNGVPASNGAPAQVVVGQPNFVTITPGTSNVKMSSPFGVWTDGTRLAVADLGNNRVLVWTTFPTSNGQAADVVVGQPDFATATSGTGAQKMDGPYSVCSDGVQLFVADRLNHRVLVFSPFPTANNPAATGVLGQSSFTNVTANDDDQNGSNDGSPTGRTISVPQGVTTVGNQLFVADTGNERVLIFTGS